MPLLNGIEAARQIHRYVPSAGILMLSTYHADQEVRAAMAAGARGYMMKEGASSELLTAVRQIRKGQSYFSPAIVRRMRRQTRGAFLDRGETAFAAEHLTHRELQVLGLLAAGGRNRDMGEKLGVSLKTIGKHRQSVMNKLDIHEPSGLTLYAIAKGMVPCLRPALVPQNVTTDALNISKPSPVF